MSYHLIEIIKSLYKNTSVQIDTGRKILEKIYIIQGVRQGCNLSPVLLNIYTDDLLRNWKHKADAGTLLKRNLYLNTLLFADDQVVMQDSEDKLQKSVYTGCHRRNGSNFGRVCLMLNYKYTDIT